MRRKKKSSISEQGLVIAFVVLATSYVYNYYVSHQEVKAQTETTSAESETASTVPEESTTTKTTSSKKVTRARGVEIPAYLTDRDEGIVQHEGFTLSYNRSKLVPNWVAWVLTKERTQGTEKRADNFQPDLIIQNGPIAYDTDYRRSGYDRGHMCPAADCKHSRASMNECFLLSNMCPQLHALNAGDWEKLETKCRKWAVKYDSIYIVCGPIIEKGQQYETIGENKVIVPKQFFNPTLPTDENIFC